MNIKRISPRPISICGLLISIVFLSVFSANSFGQNDSKGKKIRTVYVTSSASARVKKNSGIRVIKSKANDRDVNKPSKSSLELEKKAFRLINEKRASFGLRALQWNDKIAELARQHSRNMADYKFFSHKGLNGRLIDERANDFGITRWQAISENIAFNRGFSNPAEFAVERWMKSTGHRQNLLNGRWQQSGIGLGVAPDGSHYFTQIFLDND